LSQREKSTIITRIKIKTNEKAKYAYASMSGELISFERTSTAICGLCSTRS
jgi:hypothetical protein